MRIAIGADKGGFALKNLLCKYLEDKGLAVTDHGIFDLEKPNCYPASASAVATAVQKGEAERGILVCGSGMGMAITANKHKGVYAAVVESVYTTRMCRQVNNANVLCLGAMILGEGMAREMVDVFLSTDFLSGLEEWRLELLTNQFSLLGTIEERAFR